MSTCYYDPELCNWDEALERAWASRRPGEVGMICCKPRPDAKKKNGAQQGPPSTGKEHRDAPAQRN